MARTKLVCQVLTPVAAYAKNAHTNLVLAALERRGKKHPIIGELDCTVVSKLENGSHTQFWGNVRIRRKSMLGYITVTVTVTVWAHSPLYLVAYLILFLPSRHRMLGDQLRSS